MERLPRVGWGIADQALSSLLNLGLGLLVARSVTSNAFGAFALAFSTYLLVLGVCRALIAEPLLVRHSAATEAVWRAAVRAATGAGLLVGLAFGVVCLVSGRLVGGLLGEALFALGLVLPGLLLQDTWRYAFFAGGQGKRAFANDLAWLVSLRPVLTVLELIGVHSVEAFVIGWGLAAWLAAAVGALQARLIPNVCLAHRWISTQKDLAVPFLGEFVAVGAGELALFGVGGLVGLAAVGALRGGQILLGPLRVLFLGIRLVAIPDGVRLLRRSPLELRRLAGVLSTLLVAAALGWAGVLLLLPATLGEKLLGSSWQHADATILPLSLAMAGIGAMTGAFVGLRALAAARRSLRSRVLIVPFTLAAALAGAELGGAPGTAWGTALVSWLAVGVWWRQFLNALAEHSAGGGVPPRQTSSSVRAVGRRRRVRVRSTG
jgi:hypothetical protein